MAFAWSFPSSLRRFILSVNARGIIGSVFALACIQKLWAGQFLRGEVLAFSFLTEPRFCSITQWFDPQFKSVIVYNQSLVSKAMDTGNQVVLKGISHSIF